MDNFLRKAGVGEAFVPEAVVEYEANFKRDYPVRPFPGTEECITALQEDWKLAIVTSNTSANVIAALGPSLSDKFSFVLGIDNGPLSKIDSIKLALDRLGVPPEKAWYVGDTKKDYDCSLANGVRFLGANYGFEDLEALVLGCPLAHSVDQISVMIGGNSVKRDAKHEEEEEEAEEEPTRDRKRKKEEDQGGDDHPAPPPAAPAAPAAAPGPDDVVVFASSDRNLGAGS